MHPLIIIITIFPFRGYIFLSPCPYLYLSSPFASYP